MFTFRLSKRSVLNIIVSSGVMFGILFFLDTILERRALMLVLEILTGIIVYVVALLILQDKTIKTLLITFISKMQRVK